VIDEYINGEYGKALKVLMVIAIFIIGVITVGPTTVLGIQLPNPVYSTNTHVKDLVQLYKNGIYFTDFFIAVHDQANSSNTAPEQKIAWNALKTAMWTSITNSKTVCNMYKPMPMYQAQCDIDLSYIYEVCKLYPLLVATQNPSGADANLTCENPVIKQYLIDTKHYAEWKINGLAWKFVMNQAIFINPSSEATTELSEYSNFKP
jgi:hypothetical protein